MKYVLDINGDGPEPVKVSNMTTGTSVDDDQVRRVLRYALDYFADKKKEPPCTTT